jgi:hypothetical protein
MRFISTYLCLGASLSLFLPQVFAQQNLVGLVNPFVGRCNINPEHTCKWISMGKGAVNLHLFTEEFRPGVIRAQG